MSKNETGEFELVLGNKQLLSVFFIVVILLAVFFTMGYIVGRNSAPPPLEATNRKPEVRNPLIVDSPNAPPPSQIPGATEAKPSTPEPKREETAKVDPPKPEVKAPEPKPEPKPEEKPKPAEKEKEKEKPKEKEKEKKKPAPEAAAAAGGSPARGTQYLQVQALPSEQAAIVLDVLRKKGFGAATETVPNKPGLTRILVGPIDPGTANEMRDKLDQAGFKGKQSILRKF
jgi:outer membrane biosynthesis protein TonB